MPLPDIVETGWQRVLLLGGPWHLYQAKVRENQAELFIVVVGDIPAKSWEQPNAPVDTIIGNTYRYYRSSQLAYHNTLIDVFEYGEMH